MLKKLYAVRNSGTVNVPESFNLHDAIMQIAMNEFDELRSDSEFQLPDLEWCLVTTSRALAENERIHFSRYLVTNEQFDKFLLTKMPSTIWNGGQKVQIPYIFSIYKEN